MDSTTTTVEEQLEDGDISHSCIRARASQINLTRNTSENMREMRVSVTTRTDHVPCAVNKGAFTGPNAEPNMSVTIGNNTHAQS